mmetsp:Transcript_64107/g.128888  ORF Transcript_64107/g.128888 Transcript_64107/m.128888 type:complete len:250 (+) Transcript_64107:1777-2526(+)
MHRLPPRQRAAGLRAHGPAVFLARRVPASAEGKGGAPHDVSQEGGRGLAPLWVLLRAGVLSDGFEGTRPRVGVAVLPELLHPRVERLPPHHHLPRPTVVRVYFDPQHGALRGYVVTVRPTGRGCLRSEEVCTASIRAVAAVSRFRARLAFQRVVDLELRPEDSAMVHHHFVHLHHPNEDGALERATFLFFCLVAPVHHLLRERQVHLVLALVPLPLAEQRRHAAAVHPLLHPHRRRGVSRRRVGSVRTR